MCDSKSVFMKLTHVPHQGGIPYCQLGDTPGVHRAPGAFERLVVPEKGLVTLELEFGVHQVDGALSDHEEGGRGLFKKGSSIDSVVFAVRWFQM